MKWLLAVFCGILFFWNLGDRDLVSSHEARAAQNAQTILNEGHWLVPRLFDRHVELQKPPLFYWLVALIGWLQGGVDAWAVRLPSALSALGCVLFLHYAGVRLGRPRAGLFAALILASCVHFTWLARVGRIDMPLTFAITLALGSFHLGNQESATRWRWHLLGYTSLALGVLLKGPIALVLPTAASAAIWLRHGKWSIPTTLWWGVPWLFALATPWFVWANHQTNNQLWEVFFWHHNVERGLGGAESLAAHPWWFYGPRAFIDLLPWSFVVPLAGYFGLRNENIRKDPLVGMGILWFAAIALFLSCMRFKRADYLLPAYPGIAIALGVSIDHWLRQRFATEAPLRLVFLARASACVALIVYASAWLSYNAWTADIEQPYRTIAQEIRQQTSGPIVFFRAESHVLAFHVGQPLHTILEWENLAIWANRPRLVYFVMPEACAREWRDHLPAEALIEVMHTTDYVNGKRDRPLVVLRNRGKPLANR